MPKNTPESRTSATAPKATRHLNPLQKQALDLQAEAEHTDGSPREELTQEFKKLGSSKKPQ